ncbi:MAG: hypothetical protein K2F64_02840 [Muribaculaceae bacterium]|nr:hypothetical protein [Muribaculaceae bacterium]
MKKLISFFILSALAISALPISAKTPCGRHNVDRDAPCYVRHNAPRGRHMPPRRDNSPLEGRAFRGLHLSTPQQAAVNDLMEKRSEDFSKLSRKMHKEREKLEKKYDKKMMKILSPEQYASFKANRGRIRRNAAPSGCPEQPCPEQPCPQQGCYEEAAPDTVSCGIVGPIVPGPQPRPLTSL